MQTQNLLWVTTCGFKSHCRHLNICPTGAYFFVILYVAVLLSKVQSLVVNHCSCYLKFRPPGPKALSALQHQVYLLVFCHVFLKDLIGCLCIIQDLLKIPNKSTQLAKSYALALAVRAQREIQSVPFQPPWSELKSRHTIWDSSKLVSSVVTKNQTSTTDSPLCLKLF